jgi:hypothetical protein
LAARVPVLPAAVAPPRLSPAAPPAELALILPRDALVLVAGVPGAGKTTLLRRVAAGGADRLDSDPTTDATGFAGAVGGARYALLGRRPRLRRLLRPLVHVVHHARIHRRLRRRGGAVLVHETGTRRWARRAIARSARRGGHEPHLLVLDVPRDLALAGQRERGRTVSEQSLDRHVSRARALLDAPEPAARDGYASVLVLTREQADRLTALRFTA